MRGISILNGQKPCTRIIWSICQSFLYFVPWNNTKNSSPWEREKINLKVQRNCANMSRLTFLYSSYACILSSLVNPREIIIFFSLPNVGACFWAKMSADSLLRFTDCRLNQSLCVFQEEITNPASSEITHATTTVSLEIVSEPDPFKKFQDIRHQDFGEIVFRKSKKSKKKANRGMLIK